MTIFGVMVFAGSFLTVSGKNFGEGERGIEQGLGVTSGKGMMTNRRNVSPVIMDSRDDESLHCVLLQSL